ncbi:MAG: hypothetical protein HC804_13115 [Anaerolineae bacterium]|nr:hypothetical protein [Anaerolineae bacterium]
MVIVVIQLLDYQITQLPLLHEQSIFGAWGPIVGPMLTHHLALTAIAKVVAFPKPGGVP